METTWDIEELKRLNLVDFLTRHYGLEFQRTGDGYVCSSPFTEDRNPSFFVRLVNGHWLFKCFSSNCGGSIIDFVRIKENLQSVREAVEHIGRRISSLFSIAGGKPKEQPLEDEGLKSEPSYDISHLYKSFRKKDVSVCRDYLAGRGIAESLVDELITEGVLVHNRHSGHSYCCFAVRNVQGELVCLDNHQIDGDRKFVLGRKSIFTRDWDLLPKSETVFVCEGVIDYLSVKTLEKSPPPGLALLGNQVNFDPSIIESVKTMLSALDDDPGGYSAFLDLQEQFPDKEIRMYDLEECKDPNELLMAVRSGKGRKLPPERKLELYQEFQKAPNRSKLAEEWGVDRSYMYEIAKDSDKILLEAFSGRTPGRKPVGKPSTMADALQRIEELEKKYEKEATEREKVYCHDQLLQVRLKWAEIEVATLRGEAVDESTGPKKKTQIKKKKKRRRSRRSRG
ncbi:MAG: hypothetical protein GY866_22450 [Proteobacteria bacterium]|nr:hypothetical protein [Pseudomonadota bacterium]